MLTVRPPQDARAAEVSVGDEALVVTLTDGRRISAPITWFPRLERATPEERSDWRLVGRGRGTHWPSIDEDVSVPGLLGAGS